MTKAPKQKSVTRKTAEPSRSGRVVLSSVMRYDNPGQLTVPNHLNLGNDGKLYLTRSSETEDSKAKPQAISLKESVAWFRLGHDYSLDVAKGERFSEWLKMIESALARKLALGTTLDEGARRRDLQHACSSQHGAGVVARGQI